MPPPAPGHPVTAAVLMTNPSGELFIVRPAKGNDAPWQLPGGIVEEPESPLDAVRREGREELGLDLDVTEHDLFAVEAGGPVRILVLFDPLAAGSDQSAVTEHVRECHERGAMRWGTTYHV